MSVSLQLVKLGERPVHLVGAAVALDDVAVYRAERSIVAGRVFDAVVAAQALVDGLVAGREWRRMFPAMESVRVRAETDESIDFHGTSTTVYSVPVGRPPFTAATVTIRPGQTNDVLLAHGLAHAVKPRTRASTGGPAVAAGCGHDEMFRRTFVDVLGLMAGSEAAMTLADALGNFGAPPANQIVAFDEMATTAGDYLPCGCPDGLAPGESQPFGSFATWLMDRQGCGPDEVATTVSRVEQFSGAQVRELAALVDAPEDIRMLRRALYVGVALGGDPWWLESAYGLSRSTTGAKVKDLNRLNRKWVTAVRRMRGTMQQYPPMWHFDGVH